MPVTVQKVGSKYSVRTPNQTHAYGTTRKNAERQARLLHAVDHGWHHTGKAAKESVYASALRVADRLLEFYAEPGEQRPGSPEDPWRQTKGPLPKLKFMKKAPERLAPDLKKLKKKASPRFQWRPEEPTSEALGLVNQLLAEVDEIDSLPIPASAKRYARISGMRGLRSKQQNYIEMCRDLGNRGKSTQGFPNHDGSEYTASRREAMDSAPVSEPLERHHTEKTEMGKGRYGKGVNPSGKTSGKFVFPGQWNVAHAIKS